MSAPLVTTAAYAAQIGRSVRQVQRLVKDGRLPAVDVDGAVMIPADAVPARVGDVVTTSPTSPAPAPVPAVSPIGALGTLEEAAALLGTDRAGIRRMGRDGLLIVGPYGPHRSLRVYVPAR